MASNFCTPLSKVCLLLKQFDSTQTHSTTFRKISCTQAEKHVWEVLLEYRWYSLSMLWLQRADQTTITNARFYRERFYRIWRRVYLLTTDQRRKDRTQSVRQNLFLCFTKTPRDRNYVHEDLEGEYNAVNAKHISKAAKYCWEVVKCSSYIVNAVWNY